MIPRIDGARVGTAAARLRRPRIERLTLAEFRSYPALDIAPGGALVVLLGDNGAGKTNILEAISMLAPGRGLRRAELADCARDAGSGGWAVSATLRGFEADDEGEPVQIGTGIEAGDGGGARKCRLNRAPLSSARAFADHLRIVWLTPAMDSLFLGPAADRRRFLDRLVLTVDADHGTRVNALERALRSRNRLLEEGRSGGLDRTWAEAVEREAATLAVAVAAGRHETVARLAALIAAQRDDASPFPWADLMLDGLVERLVASAPALEAEDRYRAVLRENRMVDMAAGRTTVGPHLSDLLVRHGPKGVEASRASTGEQKALLVGLVLAHARLVGAMSGIAPTMLLDEIAAHLDPSRRRALFNRLADLGGQVFMTGADPQSFAELRDQADLFLVSPGAASAARFSAAL